MLVMLLLQFIIDITCRGLWDLLAIEMPTCVSFQTGAALSMVQSSKRSMQQWLMPSK